MTREVAARAEYLGGDRRERITGRHSWDGRVFVGTGGAIGGVRDGDGGDLLLLLRAEELLGAVGLQDKVVGQVREEVLEYGERL